MSKYCPNSIQDAHTGAVGGGAPRALINVGHNQIPNFFYQGKHLDSLSMIYVLGMKNPPEICPNTKKISEGSLSIFFTMSKIEIF